jgi:hypothetical protein
MRSLLPLENGTAEARLAQRAPLPQYVVTTTEDSLAKEALLPLDIWLVISESFLTRATLCSLCLVSKGLNRIFTPVLYHTVASLSGYSRWERKLKKMSKLDSETHLQFTRHLEIGYSRLAPIVDPAVLRSLFEKMARLRSCKVWYVYLFAPTLEYFRSREGFSP